MKRTPKEGSKTSIFTSCSIILQWLTQSAHMYVGGEIAFQSKLLRLPHNALCSDLKIVLCFRHFYLKQKYCEMLHLHNAPIFP